MVATAVVVVKEVGGDGEGHGGAKGGSGVGGGGGGGLIKGIRRTLLEIER